MEVLILSILFLLSVSLTVVLLGVFLQPYHPGRWRVEFIKEGNPTVLKTNKFTLAGALRFAKKQKKAYILDEETEQYLYFVIKGVVDEF